MATTIQIQRKHHYGVDNIYPVSHVEELRALTGTVTLHTRHLKALRKLGFEFEMVEKYQTSILEAIA